jgi:hypothetical protein
MVANMFFIHADVFEVTEAASQGPSKHKRPSAAAAISDLMETQPGYDVRDAASLSGYETDFSYGP